MVESFVLVSFLLTAFTTVLAVVTIPIFTIPENDEIIARNLAEAEYLLQNDTGNIEKLWALNQIGRYNDVIDNTIDNTIDREFQVEMYRAISYYNRDGTVNTSNLKDALITKDKQIYYETIRIINDETIRIINDEINTNKPSSPHLQKNLSELEKSVKNLKKLDSKYYEEQERDFNTKKSLEEFKEQLILEEYKVLAGHTDKLEKSKLKDDLTELSKEFENLKDIFDSEEYEELIGHTDNLEEGELKDDLTEVVEKLTEVHREYNYIHRLEQINSRDQVSDKLEQCRDNALNRGKFEKLCTLDELKNNTKSINLLTNTGFLYNFHDEESPVGTMQESFKLFLRDFNYFVIVASFLVAPVIMILLDHRWIKNSRGDITE